MYVSWDPSSWGSSLGHVLRRLFRALEKKNYDRQVTFFTFTNGFFQSRGDNNNHLGNASFTLERWFLFFRALEKTSWQMTLCSVAQIVLFKIQATANFPRPPTYLPQTWRLRWEHRQNHSQKFVRVLKTMGFERHS